MARMQIEFSKQPSGKFIHCGKWTIELCSSRVLEPSGAHFAKFLGLTALTLKCVHFF